jgi:hypothetical protein
MRKTATAFALASVVALLAIGLGGCPNPEEPPVVYTAGSYLDGAKMVACTWAGTERTPLPGLGANGADAYAICVAGGTV